MYQLVLIYIVTMVTYCILLIKVLNLQIFRILEKKIVNLQFSMVSVILIYSFEIKFQELYFYANFDMYSGDPLFVGIMTFIYNKVRS